MGSEPVLSSVQRAFLEAGRRAVLATIASDGRPRLVPVCFIVDAGRPIVYSPIDDKPKQSDDPMSLARVRDIQADPRVTLIVDRWDEDWSRLAWLRGAGRADVMVPSSAGPEQAAAVAALRAKYPQYGTHDLANRPIIRITLDRVINWGPLDDAKR